MPTLLKLLLLSLALLSPLTLQETPRRGIDPKHNHFDFGAYLIPHPDKVHRGGEDAFFANYHVLAVADGVGGWNRHGIDPSMYSRTLCKNVEALLKQSEEKYASNPQGLIGEAAERNPHMGSSTMIVATLDRDQPVLRVSYLGDSLYVLYRNIKGKWLIVYAAEDQQKKFNMPFQLGTYGDSADDALNFRHNVQEGDILFVASDGLFDNLTPEEVQEKLMPFIDENGVLRDPQAAAEAISKDAFKLSLDKEYDSPFAKKAMKASLYWAGGKSDDITVLVGQVKLGVQPEPVRQHETEKIDL